MKAPEDIQIDFERFKADILTLERFLTGTRISYHFFQSEFPKVKREFENKERTDEEVVGMHLFEDLHSSIDKHEIEVFKYCFINLIARTDAYLNDVANSIYKLEKPEKNEELRRKIILKYSHASFSDKLKHLKSEFGLSFPYVEKNRATIVELYSTRNLILHNDSKVNDTYLKINKDSELQLGARRIVNEEYLKLAFIMVVLVGKSIPEQVSRVHRLKT